MPGTIAEMIHSCDIEALILSGGKAVRLGGINKATMIIAGRPQFERLWCGLRPGVSRVWVSANQPLSIYRQLGCQAVADGDMSPRDGGPVAGVFAAWPRLTRRYLLLVPVDAVGFSGAEFSAMVHRMGASGVPVVRLNRGGRDNPTCALIDREQLGRPERPGGSVFAWQDQVPCARVNVADGCLLSVNTPDELAVAQAAY